MLSLTAIWRNYSFKNYCRYAIIHPPLYVYIYIWQLHAPVGLYIILIAISLLFFFIYNSFHLFVCPTYRHLSFSCLSSSIILSTTCSFVCATMRVPLLILSAFPPNIIRSTLNNFSALSSKLSASSIRRWRHFCLLHHPHTKEGGHVRYYYRFTATTGVTALHDNLYSKGGRFLSASSHY